MRRRDRARAHRARRGRARRPAPRSEDVDERVRLRAHRRRGVGSALPREARADGARPQRREGPPRRALHVRARQRRSVPEREGSARAHDRARARRRDPERVGLPHVGVAARRRPAQRRLRRSALRRGRPRAPRSSTRRSSPRSTCARSPEVARLIDDPAGRFASLRKMPLTIDFRMPRRPMSSLTSLPSFVVAALPAAVGDLSASFRFDGTLEKPYLSYRAHARGLSGGRERRRRREPVEPADRGPSSRARTTATRRRSTCTRATAKRPCSGPTRASRISRSHDPPRRLDPELEGERPRADQRGARRRHPVLRRSRDQSTLSGALDVEGLFAEADGARRARLCQACASARISTFTRNNKIVLDVTRRGRGRQRAARRRRPRDRASPSVDLAGRGGGELKITANAGVIWEGGVVHAPRSRRGRRPRGRRVAVPPARAAARGRRRAQQARRPARRQGAARLEEVLRPGRRHAHRRPPRDEGRLPRAAARPGVHQHEGQRGRRRRRHDPHLRSQRRRRARRARHGQGRGQARRPPHEAGEGEPRRRRRPRPCP